MHATVKLAASLYLLPRLLRVLVGRGRQLEPPLTGGSVSRVYFQKAVESFVSLIEIVLREIGSREVEICRPYKMARFGSLL